MKCMVSGILIAFAVAGCGGMQPHPSSTASAAQDCGPGVATGSHIMEKNNCDTGAVRTMGGDAVATAMRQSNPGSVQSH
jgi:hypothetical protein